MVILPVHQGEPAWHAARAKYYRTASRTPAMFGVGHQSRNELMREIHTGISKEFSPFVQERIIDHGHVAENATRMLVEKHLKAPLLPLTCLSDDEYLLASFDGINEELRVGWENKDWNEELAGMVRNKKLSPRYFWQLEAQAAVGNLEYVIFTCSNGTPEKTLYMKYVPVPDRRDELLAGWRQFDIDLTAYTPPEVLPPVTAAPVMALPALSIQVSIENGMMILTDNIEAFGVELKTFIARIPVKPATDQEFVNCKDACKRLQAAQDALDAAETHALGQIAAFHKMQRTKGLYWDLARTTRLATEKLVEIEEKNIKTKIVQAGKAAYAEHLTGLNKRLGKPYMPAVPDNFFGVIKGLSKLASLQNAVDTELARVKIESNAVADKIALNLIVLADHAEHEFLFADIAQLVLKAPEDFVLAIQARIQIHVKAEAERIEKERERIRAEEQAKAEREARAKVEAEDRLRLRAIEEAEYQKAAAAQTPAPAPAIAPVESVKSAPAAAPIDNILDHEGLIRSFLLTRKEPPKKISEMRAVLVEFCKFVDKFRTERRAA